MLISESSKLLSIHKGTFLFPLCGLEQYQLYLWLNRVLPPALNLQYNKFHSSLPRYSLTLNLYEQWLVYLKKQKLNMMLNR